MKKFLCFILSAGFFLTNLVPYSKFCQVNAADETEVLLESGEDINSIVSKLDDYVNRYISKTVPGAAVAVIKNGDTVLRGYGYADIENKEDVNPYETAFNYGSISKLFIWVSAMQLVEQGKLDLNKDIREYLPEGYPIKIKYDCPVTMLNLMNHNAGFDSGCSQLGETNDENTGSLGAAIRLYYDIEQCFKPNSVVGYSCYGSALASFIIERIVGKDFYKYVEENIFEPCGMKCCYPERHANPEVMSHKAKGYSHHAEGQFNRTGCYCSAWLYPCGSVVGTIHDLALFAKALMPSQEEKSPLFFNNSTISEMFETTYSPKGDELFSIHHGFWGTNGIYRGFGHTGSVQGFTANFVVNPLEKTASVALANDARGYDISFGAVNLVMGPYYEDNYTDTEDFPDSLIFEGLYLNSAIRHHNRTKGYLPYKVKAIDRNNIEISVGDEIHLYKQIRPYVFENTSDKGEMYFKSKIQFKVENGKVTKGSMFYYNLIPMSSITQTKSTI